LTSWQKKSSRLDRNWLPNFVDRIVWIPCKETYDEDQLMKSQMEKMVPSYDTYMKKMTFGREHALPKTTVNLAQVKPGDSILEVG
jgi:hypothetical protein